MESILHQFRTLAHGLCALDLKGGKKRKGVLSEKNFVATNVDKPIKGLTNTFSLSDHAGSFFSVVNVHHPLGISPK